jgi:hypothetical protein
VGAVPDAAMVREFQCASDLLFTQIQLITQYEVQARGAQYQATARQGKDSVEAVTDDVQKILAQTADRMDAFLGKACDALETMKGRNPGNPYIKDLCDSRMDN